MCVNCSRLYESDGTGGIIEQREHNVLLCKGGRGAEELIALDVDKLVFPLERKPTAGFGKHSPVERPIALTGAGGDMERQQADGNARDNGEGRPARLLPPSCAHTTTIVVAICCLAGVVAVAGTGVHCVSTGRRADMEFGRAVREICLNSGGLRVPCHAQQALLDSGLLKLAQPPPRQKALPIVLEVSDSGDLSIDGKRILMSRAGRARLVLVSSSLSSSGAAAPPRLPT